MLYSERHQMAELMNSQPGSLFLISRFGIPFGVGEQTIGEVCAAQGIDTETFLAVLHFQLYHQPVDVANIDIPSLRLYLGNAHKFYINHRLPYLRRLLIEAMPGEDDHQVVMLILRFYDAFAVALRRHIKREEAGNVLAHEKDDLHIAKKISELSNLIVRYYPTDHSDEYRPLIVEALENLHQTEKEIMAHCAIEDEILIPALKAQHEKDARIEDKSLSDREKEVLVELVNGNSNKEIADHLCLSVHTVISHRKNIVRKLGIRSTAGLTIYAVVNHLVEIEK